MMNLPFDDRRRLYATGHLALHWPKAEAVIDDPSNTDKTATVGMVQTLSTELQQTQMFKMQAGPQYWHSTDRTYECSWGMHYISPGYARPAIYHRGFPYLIDIFSATPPLPDVVCVIDYLQIPESIRIHGNPVWRHEEIHGIAIDARYTPDSDILHVKMRLLKPFNDEYGAADLVAGSDVYDLVITLPPDCVDVHQLLFSGDTSSLFLTTICTGSISSDSGYLVDRFDISWTNGVAMTLASTHARVALYGYWKYRVVQDGYESTESSTTSYVPEGWGSAALRNWSWSYSPETVAPGYLMASTPYLSGNTLVFVGKKLESHTASGSFSAEQVWHNFLFSLHASVVGSSNESIEISYHQIELDVISLTQTVTPLAIPNTIQSWSSTNSFNQSGNSIDNDINISGNGSSSSSFESVEFRHHADFDVLLAKRTVVTTASSGTTTHDSGWDYTSSGVADTSTELSVIDHNATIYSDLTSDSSASSSSGSLGELSYSDSPTVFTFILSNLSSLFRFAESGDKALVVINVEAGSFVKSSLYDREGEVESVLQEIVDPDLPLSIVSHTALAARAWQPLTQYTRGAIREIRQGAEMAWKFWGESNLPDFFLARPDVAEIDPAPDFYYCGEFILVQAQDTDYPWQYWLCTQAGISGEIEPDWSAAASSGTVVDGDVDAGTAIIWSRIGCVFQKIFG